MQGSNDFSREGSLIKNTGILALGTFLPKVTSIVVLPILTGYLTTSEYGTYDLITILVSLLLPALTLQIQAGAFRFLIDCRSDREKSQRIISSTFAFATATTVAGLVVIYFLLPNTSPLANILICLYFLFDVWLNCSLQCARGLGDNTSYAIASITSSVVQLICTFVFVRQMQGGLIGCLAMLLASAVAAFAYISIPGKIATYYLKPDVSIQTIKELLAYSWPMVPNTMSMWAMTGASRLIVTFFMGTAANAVFAIANKIPSIVLLAQNTFTMAWQENASIASKDTDSNSYYSQMLHALFNIMAGFTALLIATTPVLFALLVRGDYNDAYPQISIIFIAIFFSSISAFLGGIYVAKKKTFDVGITTIVCAALNAALNWVAVPAFGLTAASVSMVVSYLALMVFRMVDIRRICQLHYEPVKYVTVSMLLAVMGFMCSRRIVALDLVNLALALLFNIAFNRTIFMKIVEKGLIFISSRLKQR